MAQGNNQFENFEMADQEEEKKEAKPEISAFEENGESDYVMIDKDHEEPSEINTCAPDTP